MAALYYRKKTGKGQFIDIAQVGILMRSMDWDVDFPAPEKTRLSKVALDQDIDHIRRLGAVVLS